MTRDAADTIMAAAERAGAVALGPGLGRTEAAQALVGHLLESLDKPVVLDADGLFALVDHLDWVFPRDAPTVLTPHAGELGRLIGRPSSWVDMRCGAPACSSNLRASWASALALRFDAD